VSPTTRGPYAKTAATKQRILEACIDAFAEGGFHGATMKDIARRAGISYTGLLHHFPKKDELLLAVLDLRAERDHEFLGEIDSLDPLANPGGVLRGMLEITRRNQKRPGLIELHAVMSGEAASADHPAHQHYIENYNNLRTYYKAMYSALARDGLLSTSAEPRMLADLTISVINGIQGRWLFDHSVDMEKAMRTFLAGIVPQLESLVSQAETSDPPVSARS